MQRNGLPYLQSLVMVLLKVVLANVTALVTQSGQPEGVNGVGPEQTNGDGQSQGPSKDQSGRPGPAAAAAAAASGEAGESEEDKRPALSHEEVDAMRMREVTSKAVSGVLLLLLRWFKISRECVPRVWLAGARAVSKI